VNGTAGPGYSLQFTAGALSATSNSFTLTAGTATQLSITTQPPASIGSGQAFAPVVLVQDASNNPVPGISVTVSFASGTGSFSGTTTRTTDGAGHATFTGLAVNGTAGPGYSLRFAAGALSATSNSFTLTAGAATQLSITTQPPASIGSGQAFAPLVLVRDAGNNPVPGISVTVSFASGTGSFSGTTTRTTDGAGNATFTGLAVNGTAGPGYSLQFTAGALSATSNSFTLTAGAATQLSITTQPPASIGSGQAFAPVVLVQDASNNPVPGISVTVSFASGTGSFSGTTTRTTDGAGHATFTGLAVNGTAGPGYSLDFTAGALSATSNPFTVTVGQATKLVITVQPGGSTTSGALLAPQPEVEIRDSGNNLVTSSTAPVTAVLVAGTGTGTLGTTLTVNAVGGIVTFADLAITGTSGTYTLRLDSSGLASAMSIVITIP